MLVIAVSLTFAVAAMLAIGVIALTLYQQSSSIMTVIAQARAAQCEKVIVFSSAREARSLVAAFAPVVRSARSAGGTATTLTSKRRPTNPFSARPLCAVA